MVFLRGLNLRLPLCCTVHIATSWFRSRMAEGDSSTKRGKLQTEHVPPDAHRSGQESKILKSRAKFRTSPPGRGRRALRASGEGASIQLDASALTRRSRTHVDLSRGER